MSEAAWAQLDRRPSMVRWRDLRERFVEAVGRRFAAWIAEDQPHHRDQLLVATGRFDQGARLILELLERPSAPRRVLDIGAGNGGVAFAFANDAMHRVYAVDLVPNAEARALRRELPVKIEQAVADGAALPFASESIDLVLLIDVFEHLSRPGDVAREAMRVLRPGGRCIITTPARLPLLLSPDPHYGVRGLLLLPNEVQRFIVDRVLRRANAYDVEHTFWHVREIAKWFPDPKTVDVVYETSFAPPGPFTVRWLTRPRMAFEGLRYRLRHFAYGPIIVHKGEPDQTAPVFERFWTAVAEPPL